MWGIWVPVSWLFGITLGWGLPGIWLAMIVDEIVRGGLFMCRWINREWLPHAQKSRDSVTESIADLAETLGLLFPPIRRAALKRLPALHVRVMSRFRQGFDVDYREMSANGRMILCRHIA